MNVRLMLRDNLYAEAQDTRADIAAAETALLAARAHLSVLEQHAAIEGVDLTPKGPERATTVPQTATEGP